MRSKSKLVASKDGLTLVTDDRGLRDKVSKNAKAISTEELVKKRGS
jgi:hypothetical protein